MEKTFLRFKIRLDLIGRPRAKFINKKDWNTPVQVPTERESKLNKFKLEIDQWADIGSVNKKDLPVLSTILCHKINSSRRRKNFLSDIEDTFLGYDK